MTELMKQYEAETDEASTWTWHGRDILTDDYIAWLEAQLTWRPVSEKPKEGQIVFAMISTGWVVAQYLNGEFYVDDGFTFGDRISGVNNWLPIPPVPEGEWYERRKLGEQWVEEFDGKKHMLKSRRS